MKHIPIVSDSYFSTKMLELFGEELMSISEMMNNIKKWTNEYWKPNSGSIYTSLN
jgi:DNA-binding PadR family transcriptional regulator